MNREIKQTRRVRIANFSSYKGLGENWLEFNTEEPEDILRWIKTHSDLPYIFVVDKEKSRPVPSLLSALKKSRSPCYPYAVFFLGNVDIGIERNALDIIKIERAEENEIERKIFDYANEKLSFNRGRLKCENVNELPKSTDVAIIGAGITGLYAATKLKENGINCCVLEKDEIVGGIWSKYANATSQVNTSECAYRIINKKDRSNRDHSFRREILEDIVTISEEVKEKIFLETKAKNVVKTDRGYRIKYSRNGKESNLDCKGIILAINDRVGQPRKIEYKNRNLFRGEIVSGISDDTRNIRWKEKNVVIVGMGAFAIENARTALEGGARKVTVVCRRHGTVCPKIIDYLNFTTPYDDDFKHPNKSNLRNMIYWKKIYDYSGATQPECWMKKVKHDGHTISVSDIWFIASYLKKLQTKTGVVTEVYEDGVVINEEERIEADIIVNCIGFERNTRMASELSGYLHVYNNNYIDKDFMYLADAYIDDNAFNSMFGSSVLEMVKFYTYLYIEYFNSPHYEEMMLTEGIEKIPMSDRKWSDYINGAMSLIRKYPEIKSYAKELVEERTNNFLEYHDLELYIAQNKVEWIKTHAELAGRPMKEEECLPYVFEKLL